MFAYETKVNEKDALVFNAGSQKEDGEVLALIEKEDGKLDLVNGLLTDGEVLQSVGNIKELIESLDSELLQHIIQENGEQLEDKLYTNWFITNYVFVYKEMIADSVAFDPTGESASDVFIYFGDTIEIDGQFSLEYDAESGDTTIQVGEFADKADPGVDISSQITAYTKNIPMPEYEG